MVNIIGNWWKNVKSQVKKHKTKLIVFAIIVGFLYYTNPEIFTNIGQQTILPQGIFTSKLERLAFDLGLLTFAIGLGVTLFLSATIYGVPVGIGIMALGALMSGSILFEKIMENIIWVVVVLGGILLIKIMRKK